MGTFYNIKSKVISFVADIRFYWFGVVLWGDSTYKIKGDDMRAVLDLIEPGDVLLRRYSHYLGSVILPGHYSHAAFYAGDNKVIHMLGEGILKEDILTFMRCDDLAILRARSKVSKFQATAKAEEFLADEIEYDFNFDSSNTELLYCTEFVDNIFGYPIRKKDLTKKVMPDDFLESDFFRLIWRKGEGNVFNGSSNK